MGGEIQWAGVEFVAAVLGIEDLALLSHQLMAIREFMRTCEE